MLTDLQARTQLQPYFSNEENTAQYKAAQKKMKTLNILGSIGKGIADIGGGALNFVAPGAGTAVSKLANTGIDAADKSAQKHLIAPVNTAFNSQIPGGEAGTLGAQTTHIGDIGNALSPLTELGTALQKKYNPTADPNYKPNNSNTGIGNSTPSGAVTSPIIADQNVNSIAGIGDTIPTSQSTIDSITKNFMDGGVIEINDEGTKIKGLKDGGAVTVQGGRGNDDIALVDTTTGKDTGVRVSKGEKLVVSQENIAALRSALAGKDKDAVFDIMSSQMKAKPKGKGYAEGGVIGDLRDRPVNEGTGTGANDFNQKISQITDKELASLYGYRGKLSSTKQDSLDAELKKRGISVKSGRDSSAYNEKGDAFENVGSVGTVFSNTLYKDGKVLKKAPEDESGTGETIQNLIHYTPDPGTKQTTNSAPPVASQNTGKDVTADNYEPPQARPVFDTTKMDAPTLNSLPEPETGGLNTNVPALPSVDTKKGIEDANKHLATKDYLSSALGYLGGSAQLGFGLAAANERLPAFSKSANWNDYLSRLKSLSETGLTANESAKLHLDSDRTYASDVSNIYNASGGNPAAVLGNLGRAATTKYGNDLNIGVVDDEARTRNLDNYGRYLGEDVNLDRMIFADRYNNTLRNKQAGANLAGAGLQNIMGQATNDKLYGPNSKYAEYMDATTKEKTNAANAQAELMKKLSDPKYLDDFLKYAYPQTTK